MAELDPLLTEFDTKLRAIRAKVLDATTGVDVVARDLRCDLFLAFAELEAEAFRAVMAIQQQARRRGADG